MRITKLFETERVKINQGLRERVLCMTSAVYISLRVKILMRGMEWCESGEEEGGYESRSGQATWGLMENTN